MEEVGIRVKNISYYKSQPWTFTDTLLMGFFCDLDGSDELHVDHQELAMARWVDREDLPEDEEQATLTMEMITRFRLESAAEPSNSVAKTI
jgi:NAD+ diphosphatase